MYMVLKGLRIRVNIVKIEINFIFILIFNFIFKILAIKDTETAGGCPQLVTELSRGCPQPVTENAGVSTTCH